MTQVMTQVALRDLVGKSAPLTTSPGTTIRQAAQAMQKAKKGAILIVDGKRLCGIFTERDLVNRVIAPGLDPATTHISEVMTVDLVVIHPNDSHWAALSVMVHNGVRHLPVVDGTQVLGVVSRRQLMALDNALMEAAIDKTEASRLFI
ncbi:MAG: CBS domain-containing protein [Candidatus Eremiobacteraeota bacterium]|nr:CBS domain-containing protein [Candidatus Eremiobacteraeota bacterium]MCW5872408.1 CBS domain-containing protein [Candidatus Eremiobacteraeota bacterium]